MTIFADSIRWLSTMGVSSLGKSLPFAAQRNGKLTRTGPREQNSAASNVRLRQQFASAHLSAGAGFNRTIGTIGVDVERASGAFDHFARNHHFLDAFEAREIEHGLEQDALQDRAQAPRAGLALDRPAGDRAKRLVGEGQLDILHLEQA